MNADLPIGPVLLVAAAVFSAVMALMKTSYKFSEIDGGGFELSVEPSLSWAALTLASLGVAAGYFFLK